MKTLYYIIGTIVTGMLIFLLGILVFALFALSTHIIMGKEFIKFLNDTIVYFFNNNKYLFYLAALAFAIPIYYKFNKNRKSK